MAESEEEGKGCGIFIVDDEEDEGDFYPKFSKFFEARIRVKHFCIFILQERR